MANINIGDVFERLTVISEPYKIQAYEYTRRTVVMTRCSCEAKTEREFEVSSLIRGNNKSCGCLWREVNHCRKHNEYKTKLYKHWCNMKTRATNPNCKYSKDYVDRGISCCEEWMDYLVFAKWAKENGYKPHLTLERIDNDKSYGPDNCSWETMKTQGRNKRNSVFVTAWGETKLLLEWEEDPRCLVPRLLAYVRIKNGWEPERAFTEPKANKTRKKK